VVDLVQAHFKQASLVVRARNTTHYYALHTRGVLHIERETLDSALMSGRSVLEIMGWQPHAARTQAWRFRRHSVELLMKMAPHQGDENKLISVAKQGRAQLEELWSRERAERAQQTAQAARAGWQAPPAVDGTRSGRIDGRSPSPVTRHPSPARHPSSLRAASEQTLRPCLSGDGRDPWFGGFFQFSLR
jgi:glutathione-regulated potassium-efflux system ancillary protein KefC